MSNPLAQLATDAEGLVLTFRSILTVALTEGALVYWHNARSKYTNAEQRKLATIAMWVSLVIVTIFSGLYTLENVIFAGGMSTFEVNVNGEGVPLTVAVGYAMTGIIVIQIAGTLGLIFHIESLSPAARMAASLKEAEHSVQEKQLMAFKAAQSAVADTVGTAQALSALRAQLAALGYSERDIANLVVMAENKINAERAPIDAEEGVIPVNFLGRSKAKR